MIQFCSPVIAVFTVLAGAVTLTAQTVTGSITGVVTDPSGAVVSGATVTAQNTATSVKTTDHTNASGVYNLRFLPIGDYSLTVEAKGFSTQQVPPFPLEIDQTVKLDATLQLAPLRRW